jgi:phage gpG-like protein
VPYARVHNEGLRAGRGRGFQMPRRQFIGESKELTKKVEDIIENEIGRILQ